MSSSPSTTRSPISAAPRRRGGWRRVLSVVGLVALLVGSLTLASGGPVGASGFSDVGPGHRFAVPVDWAVWEGVTAGYDDGSFRPTAPVSRQALAAFLARVESAELAACGSAPFVDVGVSHRFCAEISWLVAEGISGGYVDGTFRPTVVISRQAMAAFLYRVAGPGDPDPSCGPGGGPFPDVGSTHAFCGEIEWLADAGISGGYPDGTFRPTAPVSRQAAVSFLWSIAGSPTGALRMASVTPAGDPGSGPSNGPVVVSRDGRFVSFTSAATDLVPGDTNVELDVFVRDLEEGTTQRVSVATDGTESDGQSYHHSLSADGRYVAFDSEASTFDGIDDGAFDVFVHDRLTRETEAITSVEDRDRGGSYEPRITADGRFVAFYSEADDLVPGDTNGVMDVFVHDRQTGTTERISELPGGQEADGDSYSPVISDDGRWVAYTTQATNLVGDTSNVSSVAVLHDRDDGTTKLVSATPDGKVPSTPFSWSDALAISPAGDEVLFDSSATDILPGDTNGAVDLFSYRIAGGAVERLPVAGPGAQANGDSTVSAHAVSADGRYVAFLSYASNLVPGDTNGDADAFVLDRRTGSVERQSVTADGDEAPSPTGVGAPSLSGDGRHVAFNIRVALLPWDNATVPDTYVRTRFGVG